MPSAALYRLVSSRYKPSLIQLHHAGLQSWLYFWRCMMKMSLHSRHWRPQRTSCKRLPIGVPARISQSLLATGPRGKTSLKLDRLVSRCAGSILRQRVSGKGASYCQSRPCGASCKSSLMSALCKAQPDRHIFLDH